MKSPVLSYQLCQISSGNSALATQKCEYGLFPKQITGISLRKITGKTKQQYNELQQNLKNDGEQDQISGVAIL